MPVTRLSILARLGLEGHAVAVARGRAAVNVTTLALVLKAM
jgi:hypothetical protein